MGVEAKILPDKTRAKRSEDEMRIERGIKSLLLTDSIANI